MHKEKLENSLFLPSSHSPRYIMNGWLASCSGHFTTRKGDTSIHSQGGWVSPTNPD